MVCLFGLFSSFGILFIYSFCLGSKGVSVDFSKPLIDQTNFVDAKIVVKKKSKIGGILKRRTESHKSRRDTSTLTTSASFSSTTKIFGFVNFKILLFSF